MLQHLMPLGGPVCPQSANMCFCCRAMQSWMFGAKLSHPFTSCPDSHWKLPPMLSWALWLVGSYLALWTGQQSLLIFTFSDIHAALSSISCPNWRKAHSILSWPHWCSLTSLHGQVVFVSDIWLHQAKFALGLRRSTNLACCTAC